MDTAPDGLAVALTSGQLRWLLGLSNSRLEQLMTAGVITRIDKGRYTVDSIPRYVAFLRKAQEGPRDWQAVRTALGKEKLAIAKLDRAEREGRSIPTDEVIAMNTSIATVVRTRMLAVGPKLAPRLVNLKTPAEAQALVSAQIEEGLVELSQLEVTLGK